MVIFWPPGGRLAAALLVLFLAVFDNGVFVAGQQGQQAPTAERRVAQNGNGRVYKTNLLRFFYLLCKTKIGSSQNQ